MKLEAKIDRMVQKGNVKAIASVSLDGMYVIKGLKVMDGRKGLFVSMPQEAYPGQDGKTKYSNLFFGLTNMARDNLQIAVLDAYKLRLDPNYTPKQNTYSQNSGYPQNSYGGQYQQQYPEPGFPEHLFDAPEYPEFLGGSDDILPMGTY